MFIVLLQTAFVFPYTMGGWLLWEFINCAYLVVLP